MTQPVRDASAPVQPASDGTTRADRVRDAIALTLILVGIVLVVVAYRVNTQLATHAIVVPPGHSAFAVWLHNYYMELAGYAAILVGVILGVVSYIMHERRTRLARRRTSGAA
jgi:hypothetical protein